MIKKRGKKREKEKLMNRNEYPLNGEEREREWDREKREEKRQKRQKKKKKVKKRVNARGE